MSNSSQNKSTDLVKNLISTQNQMLNNTTLNQLFSKISELISCSTPECQKVKEQEILKTKLKQAEKNLAMAPSQLANVRRRIALSIGGIARYNKELEKEFKSKSYQIAKTFNQNFQEEVSNIYTDLETYKSLLINYSNVLELYEKMKKDNGLLKKDISITSGVVITNTRKSIYEYEIIDNLHSWYKWIRFFYILILIGFVIGIFFLPWETPKRNYIIVFILLCLLYGTLGFF